MVETEIKLPIPDLSDAFRKVEALGAKIQKPRHFEDNLVFDNEHQMLRKNQCLLRLRIVETRAILTFKGTPDYSRGVKDREETESEISEPEHFIQILSQLGFSVFFRYQKFRTVYSPDAHSLEICIDETPIGNFFELEGERQSIQEYARRLGYAPEQYIMESYSTLYFRWCNEHQRKAEHMLFE
jgi:adenylate cyclase class 2